MFFCVRFSVRRSQYCDGRRHYFKASVASQREQGLLMIKPMAEDQSATFGRMKMIPANWMPRMRGA